ncbi:MAG TPA: peptide deformylase, partial [Parvularcula sp.]|nr:peptide deformylase [Parvularcula sp.]
MAIREILTAPDPRLRQVSAAVAAVDDAARALMDDMLETMYAADGIGLAAIQVNVAKRIIVMDLAREGEAKAPMYFVNPEILDPSEETSLYQEGCLSVPDFYDDVERPVRCRIRFLDYTGAEQTIDAEGMLATCIQHEM